MTETTPLRISVHLYHFFSDFRQQSRIFINEDVKSIKDLQNHIKDSFGIKEGFYLQCQNFYLPPDQNVRVLNYDDHVVVIPMKSEEENLIIDVSKKKNRKKAGEIIVHELDESSTSRSKRKNKKKDKITDEIQNGSKTFEKPKKRKRKKSTSDEEHVDIEEQIKVKRKNSRKAIQIISEEVVTENMPIPPSPIKSYKLNDKIDFNLLKTKKNKHVDKPNDISANLHRYSNESNKPVTNKNYTTDSLHSQNESNFIQKQNNTPNLGRKDSYFSRTTNLDHSTTKMGSWIENEDGEINEQSMISPNLHRSTNNEINNRSTSKNCAKNSVHSQNESNTIQKNDMLDHSTTKMGSWIENEDSALSKSCNYDTSTATLVPDRRSTNILKNTTGRMSSTRNSEMATNKNGTRDIELSKAKWDENTFLTADEKSMSINNSYSNNSRVKGLTKNDNSDTKMADWDDSSFLAPTCPTSEILKKDELKTIDSQNLDLSATEMNTSNISYVTSRNKNNSTLHQNSSNNRTSSIDDSLNSEYTKTRNSYSDEDHSKLSKNASNSKLKPEYDSCFESDSSLKSRNLQEATLIPDSEKKTKHKLLKEMNSVSHVLSRISQENTDTSILSDENITTRRRVRTRKRTRKSKKCIDSPETVEKQPEKQKFYEPRIIGAPKIHKRFSDNELSDHFDSPDISKINDTVLSHSTPYTVNTKRHPDMSVIPEEYSSGTLKKMHSEAKKFLTEPEKVNDKIIFKKLKLDEEYTPIESDYILAEINFISEDKKNLELKIIAGHQELREPRGRFSILDDEEQELDETNVSLACLEWSDLIQPKLIDN